MSKFDNIGLINQDSAIENQIASGDITIRGGDYSGSGDGGDIILEAGDGSTTGGAAGAIFIRPGYGANPPTIPTVSGVPQPAEFWFVDGDNTTPGYVGFKAPATVISNTVWELPDQDGSLNEVMVTDGNGVLSWATVAGAGGVTNPMTADLNLGGFSFLHPVDIYRASNTATDTLDLTFTAQDSNTNDQVYAQIIAEIQQPSDGGERGELHFDVATFNGSLVRAITIDGSVGVTPVVDITTFARVTANVQPMLDLYNTVTAGSNPEIWFRKNDAGAVVRFGGKISCAFTDTTSDSVDTDMLIQSVKDNTAAAKLNDLTWDSDGILHLERDKGGTGASAAEIRLYEAPTNGTDYMGLKAPNAVAATGTKVFEMAVKVQTVTAVGPTAIGEDVDLVIVDASSNSVTVDLHAATNERFRPLNIKRIDATGNTVTVRTDQVGGSDTIDGSIAGGSILVVGQWTSYTLINDKGTAWYIV